MYLDYYGFEQAPFGLTPNTQLFHALPSHYQAIQIVLAAISMGEGIIKVTGEVGTGKTMVCRMLINQLGEDVALVYLPNPALDGNQLRLAIASELNLVDVSESSVVDEIQEQLLRLKSEGKRVVALVDEAQALSDDALEALRLFGNLETEQEKLLQIVLVGQPELDERLEQSHLRQLRQRITFNCQIKPLTLDETVAYIDHRVQQARNELPTELFSLSHKKAIWYASQGIPRLINQICHKSLLFGMTTTQSQTLKNQHVFEAMHDTFDAKKPKFKSPIIWGWS
ncbi:ExeA family protein [Vibrio maerlii]|uniref:ExeA family protein n=1 Tax=Vibrio maerlii TaxID=2231648 RepID=UPI000E3C8DB0|nr:AAA family ATPase [Vibrio maerlii]